ncbi:MAG: glycosyltransferase family 25 protein [Halioglobus sp.]|nr:glycosyltransferase family 25 protein [Halioglobus sp.]
MDIYVVSIPRFRERYDYIHEHVRARSRRTVHAICVDGAEPDSLPGFLSTSMAGKFNQGQIGCAAAHMLACERIVASGAEAGFVVEDDVCLPADIDGILDKLQAELASDEVISLYNRTIKREKFSRVDAVPVKDSGLTLIYPMSPSSMRTAAACLIGRDAAEGMLARNRNLQYVADDWAAFYREGAIGSIRLAHPIPCKMKSFQSTIGYRSDDSPRVKLRNVLLRSRIGKRLIALRRQLIFRVKERNIVLVAERSMISAKT